MGSSTSKEQLLYESSQKGDLESVKEILADPKQYDINWRNEEQVILLEKKKRS